METRAKAGAPRLLANAVWVGRDKLRCAAWVGRGMVAPGEMAWMACWRARVVEAKRGAPGARLGLGGCGAGRRGWRGSGTHRLVGNTIYIILL